MVAAFKAMTDQDIRVSGLILDPEYIACENASFDIVVATHVFRQVRDVRSALKDIRRVMRPRARLYAACRTGQRGSHLARILHDHAPKLAAAIVAKENAFCQENAKDLLLTEFGNVIAHLYPDELVFTSGDDVIQYLVASYATAETYWDANIRSGIVSDIDETIVDSGPLRIPNSCTLFVARY